MLINSSCPQIALVSTLLGYGADIYSNRLGVLCSVFCVAAKHGHIDIVKKLIEVGADVNNVNKADNIGNTPQEYALYLKLLIC